MNLSDNDLLMLENLAYMLGDDNPATKRGLKSITKCKTVGEFINQFYKDPNTLSELDMEGNTYAGAINGHEWAAMIRYFKSNPSICSLEIKKASSIGICYEDPTDRNHAFVTFSGTRDFEWVDNFAGLNATDTDFQIEAYNYIQNLPYGRVTVVGHSKGGNKAQYVAIRCDKVDKCVSSDGQGFSGPFMEKYKNEIKRNAHKITNYALSTDFVHMLLYKVPGAKYVYIKGGVDIGRDRKDIGKIEENHSPDALFDYYYKDGKWYVKTKNGDPYLNIGKEDPSITMLHDFVNFFSNNASDKEKVMLVTFLGGLLHGLRTEKWNQKQIISYIMKNKNAFTLFLAYLLKYVKVNNLGTEDVIKLFNALGIDLCELIYEKTGLRIKPGIATQIIDILLRNAENDIILQALVALLGGKVGRDIYEFWTQIMSKYKKIKIKTKSGEYNYSKTREYTKIVYDSIMSAISQFSSSKFPSASEWNAYSSEPWFSKMLVSIAIKCVNTYSDKVVNINKICKKRTKDAFDNISNVDKKYGGKIAKNVSKVKSIRGKIG